MSQVFLVIVRMEVALERNLGGGGVLFSYLISLKKERLTLLYFRESSTPDVYEILKVFVSCGRGGDVLSENNLWLGWDI